MEIIMSYFHNLVDLFVDMSFYIIIGLLFTGILHAFVKRSFITKQVGKKSVSSVVKASVIGVPLPLCSCGVVPTAIYLGKNGASKGAVTSFLTSTPQTGVDSIIATYGMMGPLFAVYRAVAAFISGIITGIFTDALVKDDKMNTDGAPTSCGCSGGAEEKSSCGCGSVPVAEESSCGCGSAPVVEESTCGCGSVAETSTCGCSSSLATEGSSCGCSSTQDTDDIEKKSFGQKVKSMFTYAFGEFFDEIVINFIIGILIAAVITTLIPEDSLTNFSTPLVSMLAMMIIGIPMYVCSTASIPIAVSLIVSGISPGAAFVFLFTGPVTNIASLTMLIKVLGKKTMAIYLASVALCSLAFGLLLDFIINSMQLSGFSEVISNAHGHHDPLYLTVTAVFFLVLIIFSLVKQYVLKPAKLKASRA